MEVKITEENLAARDILRKQKKYWDDICKKCSSDNLFLLHQNSVSVESRIATVSAEPDTELCRRILQICKGNEMSVYAYVLAGMLLMMHRYSGAGTLSLGIPGYKAGENVLLPFAFEINDEESVQKHILKVSAELKTAITNQTYVTSKEGMDFPKQPVLCLLESERFSQVDTGALNSDFALRIAVTKNEIELKAEYNEALTEQRKARDILHLICNTLLEMTHGAERKLSEIRILSEDDIAQIKKSGIGKTIALKYRNAAAYINKTFEKNGEKIAVADSNSRITYNELYAASNKMIAFFKEKGLKKGDRIAIISDRGVAYVTAVVAAVRMGASYVPLEKGMPQKRVEYILENSKAKLIIADDEDSLAGLDTAAIKVSKTDLECFEGEGGDLQNAEISEDDIAYIIYTSGTTGKPKGVPISHLSLVNLIEGLRDIAGINGTGECFGLLSSFCFDASIQGIFYSLFGGMKLYVFSKEERLDKDTVVDIAVREGMSLIDGTPLDLRMMLYAKKEEIGGIKYLFIGGESLGKDVTNEFYRHFKGDYQIVNVYGPTECAVDSTYMKVAKELNGSEPTVPIGFPLANKRIYILDGNLNPVPRECMGEIYVAGTGIMPGYVGNRELSAECLRSDVFFDGETMYRTGDLGYFTYDGICVCAGRIDSQIKIDGYRIEVGEVEENLRKKEEISDCVVLLHETEKAKTLRCYYVLNKDVPDDFDEEIRDYLKQYVPQYMIPKQYVKIDEIPITMNGKVDYTLLKRFEPAGSKKEALQARDSLEKEILNCFEKCVGNSNLNIDSDFFDEGGNSIKALQFISMLKDKGIEVRLIDIFTHKTVRNIYDLVKRNGNKYLSIEEMKQALESEFKESFEFETRKKGVKEYTVLRYKNSVDKGAIVAFLRKNADLSILPNYIFSFDEDGKIDEIFKDNMLIDITDSRKRLNELHTGWDRYEKALTEAGIEDTYKTNALQDMLIGLNLYKSGTNIVIERAVDTERLKKAFAAVVKKHPLLRSEIVNKDGEYFVVQHEPEDKETIPCTDCTEMPLSDKNKQIMNLINKLYYGNTFKAQGIMYRAYILKIDEKKCIISLPAHHCIYDGMSADVIKCDILKMYDELGEAKPVSYKEYTKKLEADRDEEERKRIETRFNLPLFDKFFEHKPVKNGPAETLVRNINRKKDSEEPWKIVLSFVQDMLRNTFKEKEVPFFLLNYGRRYRDCNFFNTMGPCIDLIPCTMRRDDSAEELEKRIKDNITAAELMNLNFIVSSAIQIQKIKTHPIIVFNFQGETDKETYKIRTGLTEDEAKEESFINGIYIEAFYCEDELHIMAESNIEGVRLDSSKECEYDSFNKAT